MITGRINLRGTRRGHPHPTSWAKAPRAQRPELEDRIRLAQTVIETRKARSVAYSHEEKQQLNHAFTSADKALNHALLAIKMEKPDTIKQNQIFFGKDAHIEATYDGLKLTQDRLRSIFLNEAIHYDNGRFLHGATAFTILPQTASQYLEANIFVKPSFFELYPTQQAEVLIHEAAHSILIVVDEQMPNGSTAYGLNNAIKLARQSPTKARNNADNWALFVSRLLENIH